MSLANVIPAETLDLAVAWARGKVSTTEAQKRLGQKGVGGTVYKLGMALRAATDNTIVIRDRFLDQKIAGGEFCNLPALPPEPFDGTIDGLAHLIRQGEETIEAARKRMIGLLRNEDDVASFIKVWDRMTRRGRMPMLDAVAADSQCTVSPSAVIGAATRVLHQWNFDVSRLAVAAVLQRNSTQIAHTLARAAMDPATGTKDRRLCLEALGLVKQPGANVNVTANANNSTVNADKAVVFTGRDLPSFESGSLRMGAELRKIQAAEK